MKRYEVEIIIRSTITLEARSEEDVDDQVFHYVQKYPEDVIDGMEIIHIEELEGEE